MGAMVDEIARRVMVALNAGKPAMQPEPAPPRPEPPPIPQAVLSHPPHAPREMVRRVTPLRVRTGSILGLDINNPEPEEPYSPPPE